MLSTPDVRHAAPSLDAAANLALEVGPATPAPVRAKGRPEATATPPPPASAAAGGLAIAARACAATMQGRTARAAVAGYAAAKVTDEPAGEASEGKETSGAPAEAKAATAATKATKASSSASRAKASSSGSDPLAFLKDKSLSLEEKLIKLLGYLNAKWDKEMQAKLDAIAASEAQAKKKATSSSSSSSSSKKKGGILGSLGVVGDVLQSVVGPVNDALKAPLVKDLVEQLSGPVLAAGAAVLGFPGAAAAALKEGPALVKEATSFLASIDARGSAGASGGGGSSGSTTGGGSASSGGSASATLTDPERQMLLLEIQRLQQKQQEMLGLVSNVLKTSHDARLAVIGNLR